MPRFMAQAIYTLTTPDGREVGAVFETQADTLVVQLDPAFREATRRGQARADGAGNPRLVLIPPMEG